MEGFKNIVELKGLLLRYANMHPNKPYVGWALELAKDDEYCRKAAFFKLAMDCRIKNGRIEDMTNEAVYEIVGNTLYACVLPSACLTEKEIADHPEWVSYVGKV